MHYFTASDGVRIAYEEEGSGRPLLLLHGLMAHRGFFKHQQALAADFRLIRPDLRGHGGSIVAPGSTLTVERLAQDVTELATALDLEDAIGVGWSLGASILWHVLTGPAARRFAGMVVVDMTPRVLNDGDWQLGLSREICEARQNAIQQDFPTFAANAGQAIFAQPPAAGFAEEAKWAGEEFARNDAKAMESLWASLVAQDLRPVLSEIRQPTLIVHGAQSHLYGSDTAHHLAAALPEASTIQFGGSGHSPHLEQPKLFNRVISDFAAMIQHHRETPTTA